MDGRPGERDKEGDEQRDWQRARAEGVGSKIVHPTIVHPMFMPPFTLRTCPVMYAASSLARKRTALAMSVSVPVRPSGIIFKTWSFISCGRSLVISVSIQPGATALQVMEREPTSRAMDMVSPMRPAFEAE